MRPDLSPSLQRGLNHSCPPRSEAGWSVDLLSVSTTSFTLLNYAEALTNFRPPILCNPLLVQEREPLLVDWLLRPGNTNSVDCPEWLIVQITLVLFVLGILYLEFEYRGTWCTCLHTSNRCTIVAQLHMQSYKIYFMEYSFLAFNIQKYKTAYS